MIYHDVPQGEPAWFAVRIGKVTASRFSDILTPKKLELSKSAEAYSNELIAEIILGESLEKFEPSYWMQQGMLYEGQARAAYQYETGYEIDRGGFITTNDGRVGCSPDIRVFDGAKLVGAAEIKCPAPWTHVENLLLTEIAEKNILQVQGQILIGGFEFVDWFSYHKDMPPALIRNHRDDRICNALEDALKKFTELMDDKLSRLIEKGVIIRDKTAVKAADPDALANFLEA